MILKMPGCLDPNGIIIEKNMEPGHLADRLEELLSV
jgi:hypothetical protein